MWLSAGTGDASGRWAGSLIGDLLFSKLFDWGQYTSFGRADAQTARDYCSSGGQDATNVGRAALTFGWGNGQLIDAWPAAPEENEYSKVRTSNTTLGSADGRAHSPAFPARGSALTRKRSNNWPDRRSPPVGPRDTDQTQQLN